MPQSWSLALCLAGTPQRTGSQWTGSQSGSQGQSLPSWQQSNSKSQTTFNSQSPPPPTSLGQSQQSSQSQAQPSSQSPPPPSSQSQLLPPGPLDNSDADPVEAVSMSNDPKPPRDRGNSRIRMTIPRKSMAKPVSEEHQTRGKRSSPSDRRHM